MGSNQSIEMKTARVLIVDDQRLLRQILSRMVVEVGYDVAGEAGNGMEAVTQYEQLSPDVVLLDMTMPDRSGMEALADILEIDPNARVVVCSAVNDKAQVTAAIKAGARDYVLKPPKSNRVAAAIERALMTDGVPVLTADDQAAASAPPMIPGIATPRSASAGSAFVPWRLRQKQGGEDAESDA
jgi:two-component system chemotaxis response regulator CheY